MISLRGPEFEERPAGQEDKLPPIHSEQEGDLLFQSRADLRDRESRPESRLSLTTPER